MSYAHMLHSEAGSSVLDSAFTPSGRSKSLGGTTIGGKDGILADGGLNSIPDISGAFGIIKLGNEMLGIKQY